jgi:hypothetical protein
VFLTIRECPVEYAIVPVKNVFFGMEGFIHSNGGVSHTPFWFCSTCRQMGEFKLSHVYSYVGGT